MAANDTIITKLPTGNIDVIEGDRQFSLEPWFNVYKQGSNASEKVIIMENRVKTIESFTPERVLKVVQSDGTEITISDADTLYSQLRDNFFQSNPFPTDSGLESSLGNVPGRDTVNKYGESVDCDSGVLTDLWDGADGVTSTDIWTPPTEARVHQLKSISALDIDTTGTGARTVRIDYLPNWDTKEATIIVALNGVTNVALPPLVMINRMECLTWGTGGLNAGVITATADIDTTVTSAILAGNNQTQQAIYGIPSTQKLRVSKFFTYITKGAGTTRRADGNVLFMRDPNVNAINNTAWTNKENFDSLETETPWEHDYGDIPKKFSGPGILKFQVISNTNNTKVVGGFDATLTNN